MGRIGWSALGLALALVAARAGTAGAEEQRFRVGGGAGFASLGDEEVDLGRTGNVGGFFAVRFNDNLALEAGVSFSRASRRFTADGRTIERQGDIPAFRRRSTRYHLDGTLLAHLGRREPFHPFVLFGGGLVRRDETTLDIVFTDVQIIENVRESAVSYEPTVHFGTGFDLYFLYNVAARFEVRWWLPELEWGRRSRRMLFGATYFY